MTPPASTRISARMTCVQGHSSSGNVPRLIREGGGSLYQSCPRWGRSLWVLSTGPASDGCAHSKFTVELCPRTHVSLADILVLVCDAILPAPVVPSSTRISAWLKRVQKHSSPVNIPKWTCGHLAESTKNGTLLAIFIFFAWYGSRANVILAFC